MAENGLQKNLGSLRSGKKEIKLDWEKDTIDNAMNEVYEQMPEEELEVFYQKFNIAQNTNFIGDVSMKKYYIEDFISYCFPYEISHKNSK